MIKIIKIKCAQCGKVTKKHLGHVNRARKLGLKLFCGQKCFGLSRRHNKTIQELKEEKRLYDIEYRRKNEKRLKKKRGAWFKKDYAEHPEKYRKQRKKRQKKHNEYCRQPEYRKYKKDYDRKRVAKLQYDKFWEAAIALRDLGDIVDNRQAKKDQYIFNKSQKRKRNAKNTQRKELESCVMGLYQPS